MADGSGGRPNPAAVLVTALLVGSALGLVSRLSDLLPTQLKWIANLAAPWLAVAFLVGRRASSRSNAIAAGGLALAIAAITHYVTARLFRHGLDANLLRHPVPMWFAVGVVGGGLFGAAGKAATGDSALIRVAATAVICAAFFGESAFLLTQGVRASYLLAVPFALVSALILPAYLLSTSKQTVSAILLGLFLAPAGVLAIAELQQASGRVYWIRTTSDPTQPGDGPNFQKY